MNTDITAHDQHRLVLDTSAIIRSTIIDIHPSETGRLTALRRGEPLDTMYGTSQVYCSTCDLFLTGWTEETHNL
jgi:hypothetical protein